ncbi:hypothetical protein GCM10025762_43350 [Haloechinothrix salitolerans]
MGGKESARAGVGWLLVVVLAVALAPLGLPSPARYPDAAMPTGPSEPHAAHGHLAPDSLTMPRLPRPVGEVALAHGDDADPESGIGPVGSGPVSPPVSFGLTAVDTVSWLSTVDVSSTRDRAPPRHGVALMS